MATRINQHIAQSLYKQAFDEQNEPKPLAEVNNLIKELERGAALDAALNYHISQEQWQELFDSDLQLSVREEKEWANYQKRLDDLLACCDLIEGEYIFNAEKATLTRDVHARQLLTVRSHITTEAANKIREYASNGLHLDDITAKVNTELKMLLEPNQVREVLRVSWQEVYDFTHQALKPCYAMVFIEVEHVNMQMGPSVTVKHPFYLTLGLNIQGYYELLSIRPFPKNYAELEDHSSIWTECLKDLRERGLQQTVYFVLGNVKGFDAARKAVYPSAIVQRSLLDILRECTASMPMVDRSLFNNQFRTLYRCKSLIECLRQCKGFESFWQQRSPNSVRIFRKNFIYFEQYFAAPAPLRTSIRNIKNLTYILNDVRRDIRDNHNYGYSDALMFIARTLESVKYISVFKMPSLWRKALRGMLDDSYLGKIIEPYVQPEDIALSARSLKRDRAKQAKAMELKARMWGAEVPQASNNEDTKLEA